MVSVVTMSNDVRIGITNEICVPMIANQAELLNRLAGKEDFASNKHVIGYKDADDYGVFFPKRNTGINLFKSNIIHGMVKNKNQK